MIKIAEFTGGSCAYGLDIEGVSDKDIRFVFLNNNISDIIGLSRHEHQDGINKTEDIFGYELRNFFKLLRKGNTQCLEILHNTNWLKITPEFQKIQENKKKFLDSETIFKCLSGYALSERRVIIGADTGKLGEKRKKSIEKVGFSYRNAVHCIRLLRTGILFYQNNKYPVNIFKEDEFYGEMLRDLKINPEKYSLGNILNLIDKLDNDLKESFRLRNTNFEFNNDLANELVLEIYYPILEKLKK